jgi:dephospho-CoA kinase
MVKVVIVNGFPGCGKTTFQRECEMARYDIDDGFCVSVSTVDFVKRVAHGAGWDMTKTPENRKFLSDLKQLLAEWNDSPYQEIVKAIKQYQESKYDWILFVDSREPAEIERFKKEFDATTVLVRRLGDEVQETSNESDANVLNYEYDFVVRNYGDMENLRMEAYRFLARMKEKEFYVD